jgi:hypothetical protein
MRKKFTTLALLALVGLWLGACQSKQQDSDAASKETAEAAADKTAVDEELPLSDPVKTLVGPQRGLFRGVRLGDPIATVKAKETIELFEETADHIGYTLEYPNLETFDVLYYRDKEGRVSKIDVDLYLNNRASVDQFSKELVQYFDHRYRKTTAQKGEMGWTAEAARVTLTDVSQGKNFGLRFTFAPANAPVAVRN